MSSEVAMPADGSPRPGLEFYTVLIGLNQAAAPEIVPYVRDALATIGAGSVVAVGDKGLLLTAPIHLAHYLQATIEQHLNPATGATPIPRYPSNVFYAPLLIVPSQSRPLFDALGALKLCPPDMVATYLEIDDSRAAIAVSGPADRKDDFENNVRPSLLRYLHSTEKAGFPIS